MMGSCIIAPLSLVLLGAAPCPVTAGKLIHRIFKGANCTEFVFSQEFRTGHCQYDQWYRWGDPRGNVFMRPRADPRYAYMQLECEEREGQSGVLIKYWSYDYWKQGCSWGGNEDGAIRYPAEQKCLISHTNNFDANKGNSSNVTTDVPNVASPFFDFSNVTTDVVSHSFECVRGYWWWTAEDTFWTVILLLLVLGCCISCCFIAATTQRVPNSRFRNCLGRGARTSPSEGVQCGTAVATPVTPMVPAGSRIYAHTIAAGTPTTIANGVHTKPTPVTPVANL